MLRVGRSSDFHAAMLASAQVVAGRRGVSVRLSASDAAIDPGGPAVDLERLGKQYPSLKLVSEKKSRFYHLVCDDSFAVIANRPFLGNLGKYRSFQHVSGYLLQQSELVDAFALRVLMSSANGQVVARDSGRAQ
jgi:hypothetical protein